ncbi:MAG: CpXC domain-containing protein [Coriobacteriia bacterium]|nr:CpXC domain-containing protein [Coriobacteriia bacterium]
MSRFFSETVSCPECSASNSVRIWESINVALDPDMKGKVLDFSLFVFTCEKCGSSTKLLFPLLYHNMSNSYMVNMVFPENEGDLSRTLSDISNLFLSIQAFSSDMSLVGRDYRFRAVFNPVELAEKIRIFDNGFDDRAIEIMKQDLFEQFDSEVNGGGIADILFDFSSGRPMFVTLFNNGQQTLCHFSRTTYLGIVNNMRESYGRFSSGGCEIIDRNWAREFIAATE